MIIQDIKKLDRTMLILLFGVLLSHLGTYLVIPMLPIMLKIDAALSLAQIGMILAMNAISFQFGSYSEDFWQIVLAEGSLLG